MGRSDFCAGHPDLAGSPLGPGVGLCRPPSQISSFIPPCLPSIPSPLTPLWWWLDSWPFRPLPLAAGFALVQSLGPSPIRQGLGSTGLAFSGLMTMGFTFVTDCPASDWLLSTSARADAVAAPSRLNDL